MGKEVQAGIINILSTTGGDHILDDATNLIWGIPAEGYTSSDDPCEFIFGRYFDYGTIVGYSYENAQAEVSQIAVFGAEQTEVIVADTRYSVQISNTAEKYEGGTKGKDVYSYTSPTVLSGVAQTDRAAVYQALINKVNARNNFVTAYRMISQAYTLGTSVGNAATTFIIGENVTQETSGVTAKVAKVTITSGTMFGDDAAGNVYLYDVSDISSLDAGAKTWTADGTVAGVSTNIVITGTAASIVTDTGMVITDDADYWISHITRGGASECFAINGFTLDAWEVGLTHAYSRGIGSYLLNLAPVLSRGGEDVINVYGDYMLAMNDTFETLLTYRTYVLTFKDKHKDVNGVSTDVEHSFILFVSDLNTGTELDEFEAALAAVAIK